METVYSYFFIGNGIGNGKPGNGNNIGISETSETKWGLRISLLPAGIMANFRGITFSALHGCFYVTLLFGPRLSLSCYISSLFASKFFSLMYQLRCSSWVHFCIVCQLIVIFV
jgi:hypothetical protein